MSKIRSSSGEFVGLLPNPRHSLAPNDVYRSQLNGRYTTRSVGKSTGVEVDCRVDVGVLCRTRSWWVDSEFRTGAFHALLSTNVNKIR